MFKRLFGGAAAACGVKSCGTPMPAADNPLFTGASAKIDGQSCYDDPFSAFEGGPESFICVLKGNGPFPAGLERDTIYFAKPVP